MATARSKVALIDRTHRVRRPDGTETEVNRFDYNLAIACGDGRYVQCADTSWIRADRLQVIRRRARSR